MFGYVLPNRKRLTEEQLARYQSCYCGLCRSLGRRHGLTARAALTYDMTFLVLLLSSLYEPKEEQGTVRCAVHPTKPCPYWSNEITDYAADMNLALACYNSLDNWKDDKKLSGLAGYRLLCRRCEGLRSRYPRQLRAIEYSLDHLAKLEESRAGGPDEAAGCFGTLMGELFVLREDRWSVPLRRMGAALGRFIYLLDALDDFERDRRRGSYNPLLSLDGPHFFERCREILLLQIAEAAKEFEKLPILNDADLLRNILYSGVWTKYQQIAARWEKKTDASEEGGIG